MAKETVNDALHEVPATEFVLFVDTVTADGLQLEPLKQNAASSRKMNVIGFIGVRGER